MQQFAQLLKTAGDETRLRILRLVKQYPLNVSELTAILGLAQSGISRHLGHLKKAGLIRERREGMWTYYYPVDGHEADEDVRSFTAYLDSRSAFTDKEHADHLKLMEVIKKRDAGSRGLNERLLAPGQSWQVWSRTLALLLPGLDVADFGCGDGILSLEMARFARSVISIDNNRQAIAQTRKLIARAGANNITLKEESLENTSIQPGSIDVVFFSQSLHHLDDPSAGLAEAARVLKPEGRVLIMELLTHKQKWVQEKLGHVHLGFKSAELEKLVNAAGFTIAASEVIGSGEKDLFEVILCAGLLKE